MKKMTVTILALGFFISSVSLGQQSCEQQDAVDTTVLVQPTIALQSQRIQKLLPASTLRKTLAAKQVVLNQLSQNYGRISLRNIESTVRNLTQVNGDIESLVMIVMFELQLDASNDLRETLNELDNIRKQKQRNRMGIQALHDSIQILKASAKQIYGYSLDCEQQLCQLDINQVVMLDRRDLKAQLEQLQDTKDSLSELGEAQQLKLQLLMERRSKMLEVISAILKKVTETSDQIIANLK